jgi:hypothetical protein
MQYPSLRLSPFFAGLLCAVAAALGAGGLSLVAAPPAPGTADATAELAKQIPTIPTDRVKVPPTGYPQIPPDVEELINKRSEIWEKMDEVALQRAAPANAAAEKAGKPMLKVARKPEDLPRAEIPAFPGAWGGGMYTAGGRGGKVYVVTSLADSGPGTLREAAEAGGPRIVVFNVAGIIRLERPLTIRSPYITIAGQTAPGDGVCVAGHSTHIETHDVIMRYMRFRRGSTDVTARDDALSGDSIGNIMLDHVSASWGLDETLSNYRQMYRSDPANPKKFEKLPVVNITIQWCLITEGLDTYHHAFGGTWGGMNTGFHHNLFACNSGRNASIGMIYDFNFVNNVVFNWRHRTLDGGGNGSVVTVLNNYFRPGPATNQGQLQYRIGKPEGGKWYAAGNIVHGNEKVTADNWAGGIQGEREPTATQPGAEPRSTRLDAPGKMPPLPIETAQQAYENVLAHVGATLPVRDSVDERAVRQVRTGEVEYKEGKGILTDIKQVGGYPEYKGTPVKYTQNDGIPDWWKQKFGLDVNDTSLASRDTNGDGYTVIEEYLNGMDPTKKTDWKDLKNNVNPLETPEGRARLLGK